MKNVVKLVDLFTDEAGDMYLVTNSPGKTLEDFVFALKNDASLTVKSAIALTKVIAHVILDLHKRMIIHRNICLANVHIKTGKSRKTNQLKTISSLKVGGFDLAFCFEKA